MTLTNSDLEGVLRLGNKILVPGTDFRIASYEKNDKRGTAKVTVVGIDSVDASGNPVVLAGSKTLNFKITEKTEVGKQTARSSLMGSGQIKLNIK